MTRYLAFLLIPFVLASAGCARKNKKKDYAKQLAPGELALREVDIKEVPDLELSAEDRTAVRNGIKNSLEFLKKPSSNATFPVATIGHDQVQKSLEDLDKLLATTTDNAALNTAIKSRYRAFMSVGCDDVGTVLFTGYYTPIFDGSKTPDETYKYPIYKRPADLVMTTSLEIAKQKMPDGSLRPYPDAATIESTNMLKGNELVYMKDPYEAYLVRVQGSAKLRLKDGGTMEIGYHGTNGYAYQGIGQEVVKDGKIPADKLSFFTMREYFRAHPEDLKTYTGRNPRFIFFSEVSGGPFGSLGQKVTSDVTIATDKSLFPRAAPVVVATHLSSGDAESAKLKDAAAKPINYVGLRLDQDTGGAIRAPGRCDLYMGEGDANERRAGGQYAEGKMYYLILK